MIRDVADVLARFHAEAARGPEIDDEARVGSVRRDWVDNFEQMEPHRGQPLDGADLDRARHLALEYLDGRGTLFDERIHQGLAVDGHGDLLADDIFCLPDGPRVLDCIEFDDRLRYGDALADVAFLAMDLERLGQPDLATALLSRHRELSGDRHPRSLVHHYVAYRAQVRSKVACLRHEQGDEASADEARGLLDLALGHLEEARVTLVLVGGLPGTGKSTVARGLSDDLGWTVLHSDVVRKELAGLSPETPAGASYGEGLYAPEHTDATYAALVDRSRDLLERGESVILDATWTAARHRRLATELAESTAAVLVPLRCSTAPDVAAARMRSRRSGSATTTEAGASDATPAVVEAMARDTDPWPEALTVDTEAPPERACEEARGHVDRVRGS